MGDLTVRPGRVHGMHVLEASPIVDFRGYNMRTFNAPDHAVAGIDLSTLVQDNQTLSRRRVIRGLHGRRELAELKLVRCLRGAVWDVCVDLRPWSPTFLQWDAVMLDDIAHRQILVPPGCLHGFQTVSEESLVLYRVDRPHRDDIGLAIRWDDPELDLPWPDRDPLLSERDRNAPTIAEVRDQLPVWFGTEPPAGHVPQTNETEEHA